MSQAELAKAAGLPASSIAHFESDARKPSSDSLGKLATALNVTTDYLLGRVDVADVASSDDPLARYGAQLSASDRALVEDFMRMLVERGGERRSRCSHRRALGEEAPDLAHLFRHHEFRTGGEWTGPIWL